MDLLRRELAPISDQAWQQIDEQAERVLRCLLTARRFTDVRGPYGMDFAGISTGRMNLVQSKEKNVPEYGVRRIRPLVEVRIPFSLDIWEMDNAVRGTRDVDLSPLEEAARRLAAFEEGLLYRGSPEADIEPLSALSTQKPLNYSTEIETFLKAVAEGLAQLKTTPVGGPFALVVGPDIWIQLSNTVQGRPLSHYLAYILEGPVLLSQFVEKPFLISQRGGDLEMVVGQDISIGYSNSDGKQVDLYFTESLTFQVVDPSAVLFLEAT